MSWQRAAVLVLILLGCSDPKNPIDPEPDPDPDPDPDPGNGDFTVQLETIVGGLNSPVFVTAAPGHERLFVVEQAGVINIIENGTELSPPFLDIRDKVNYGGERGLLGLAFHPQYADNGFFYVNYTGEGEAGNTRVERYRVSADPLRADKSSAFLILRVDQPYSNHNGGHIEFGPDGMLYIGLGDGGDGGDPHGHGQNRGTLLGTILRIDVNGGSPYAIPSNNPFVNTAGARPEIWAYGLRNPWRFSIDAAGGRIYIGDVGQSALEEIDVAPLSAAGLNYGWNVMEGKSCYRSSSCDRDGLTLPVIEYGHGQGRGQGCSVTGGLVYRGTAIPGLVGHYVYSDYCGAWLRSFLMEESGPTHEKDWVDIQELGPVPSFGRDAAGEILVLTVGSGGTGQLFRVVPRN